MLFLNKERYSFIVNKLINGSKSNEPINHRKIYIQKRKEKNMTQEQLAEKLRDSNKTISKWETGKCMPDYGIVKSLCEELEITIAE